MDISTKLRERGVAENAASIAIHMMHMDPNISLSQIEAITDAAIALTDVEQKGEDYWEHIGADWRRTCGSIGEYILKHGSFPLEGGADCISELLSKG